MKNSIVTKYKDICIVCGRPAECTHHLIFGYGGRRKKADEDGLTIPVCNRHHNMGNITECIHDNPAAEAMSKIAGQLAWEKRWIVERRELPFEDIEEDARMAFMDRFGRSYL